MKSLIWTLLLTVVIFLKLGELNAVDDLRSSSDFVTGRGGPRRGAGRPRGSSRAPFHPGEVRYEPLTRQHDEQFYYMGHDVFLWLDRGKVVQASFVGMVLPFGSHFYRDNNFLVRRDKIGGYSTVIFVRQDGSLMGVRAPKRKNGGDIMEPSDTECFIVFSAKYFRLTLVPELNEHRPATIELARGGNVRPREPTDIVERVTFPYSIIFCIYRATPSSVIMGAYLAKLLFNQWIGC